MCSVTPPPGRTLVFVGDLVDRGPRTPDVLRIVMSAAEQRARRCASRAITTTSWCAG